MKQVACVVDFTDLHRARDGNYRALHPHVSFFLSAITVFVRFIRETWSKSNSDTAKQYIIAKIRST